MDTAQASMPLSSSQMEQLNLLVDGHRQMPGGLLPLLHAVQERFGHVPPSAVPVMAQAMNLSCAEVHGVISFYSHFRTQALGRHLVQICQAEACRACGAEALMQSAERMLGCAAHETRADQAVSLEPVYCLGLCASSPALQLDAKLHGRVDEAQLRRLMAGLNLLNEEQA
ncbi:MAG: formate dehydrogenase subunit gamma [Burkholderiaceae bacterium]|nr:formate dehydrogenase subunit gamma [Roseateles sp.]MBV8468942.1 formate dehydrogenase subunit gamma [Burkholderiaceae bacterium]